MEPILSPRVGVITTEPDGFPTLPQIVHLGGQTARVWSEYFECTIGEYPAREYRDTAHGQLAVVCKVADVTLLDGRAAALAIAWVPSDSRTGANPTYDLMMSSDELSVARIAQFTVTEDSDGALLLDLDSDLTPAGSLARSAWPADWHKRLATDPPGNPATQTPPAPPSGPRMIAAVPAI